jgi:hypothetical protein
MITGNYDCADIMDWKKTVSCVRPPSSFCNTAKLKSCEERWKNYFGEDKDVTIIF